MGDGTTIDRPGPVELAAMDDIVDVAAGYDHSLALRSDGHVLAWGANYSGQLGDGTTDDHDSPALVPNLTHVVAIGAGGFSSLAIRADGTVWEWGARQGEWGGGPASFLVPTLVPDVTAVTSGSGLGHRLVITDTSSVVGWGFNGYGQLADGTTTDVWDGVRDIQGFDGAIQVDGGVGHSVALMPDGTLRTVGRNTHGELGDGTFTDRPSVIEVPAFGAILQIAVGDAHTMALDAEGTVWTWGYGYAGALGNGTVDDEPTPTPVSGLSGVTRIAAGNFHSMAINDEGVWAWGWTTGVPDEPLWAEPLLLDGTSGATGIAGGLLHGLILIGGVPLDLQGDLPTSLTLSVDRRVFTGQQAELHAKVYPVPASGAVTFGSNESDVWGSAPVDPVTGIATFPWTFSIGGLQPTWAQFGGSSGLLPSTSTLDVDVTAGSRVLAWGENYFGEVGDGTTTWRYAPVELAGMDDIVAVAAGYNHSLALRSDGRVLAWGDNAGGQLGDGTGQDSHVPILVPNLTYVVGIEANGFSSLALRADGSVWEWGGRTDELGFGPDSLLVPTRVEGLVGISLGAGSYHRLVVADDATVAGWGFNGFGQLADGTTTDVWDGLTRVERFEGAIQVGGGSRHSVALLSDGSLRVVGGNSQGQLGDGTFTERHAVVEVPGLPEIQQISVGGSHTIALDVGGTVWTWGHSVALGQGSVDDQANPAPVAGLAAVTSIEAGSLHSMALNDSGVWAWGWTTGVPDMPSSFVPVLVEGTRGATGMAGGAKHSLTLLNGADLELLPEQTTTLTLTVDEPIVVGEPVDLIATIVPAPDMGEVHFSTETDQLGSAPIDPATGIATIPWTFTEPGSQAIIATFDGVPGFLGSTDSVDVDIEVPDTAPPSGSVSIAGGAAWTTSTSVSVAVAATDAGSGVAEVALSSDGISWTTVAYASPVAWTLSSGDGAKTVHAKWRDGAGNWSTPASDTIGLDTSAPAVSGVTLAANGLPTASGLPYRLSWAGSDGGSGVAHYEVERSIDGGAWSTVATPAASPLDVMVDAGDATSFRVRATDVAGNTGAFSSPVSTAPAFVTRQWGSDRFATAAAVSAATFSPGVPVAYVAFGLNYPDALAAGPAAAKLGGPVLLVHATSIPSATAAELQRLKPGRIVVVGSSAVVSNAVLDALRAYTQGSVTRQAGTDRFATAAAISAATFSPGVPVAYVAYGLNYPDALAAVPAAARRQGPVLLVHSTSIPSATASELARLKPQNIVVVGSSSVVSEAVLNGLKPHTTGGVTRQAGADRFATAAAISAATFEPGVPVAYIAFGLNYPDALAAGPAAAQLGGPVLLVHSTSIPPATASELARLAPMRIVVVGSSAVVSDGVLAALNAYL